MMEIWRGQVLWRGYIHPHPHTQKSGIPHTHTHTQSMRRFPSKRRQVRTILTERVYLSSLHGIVHHKKVKKINEFKCRRTKLLIFNLLK